jgi:hypothetical protein
MFMLVRPWFERRDAIFAASLYAANPYHLLIVYWRSAFAELLASALLPLLLLLVLRAAKGHARRDVVPLGAVLAAAWLINAPAAVMTHYSLALIAVVVAWNRKSPRLILVAATAVVLGASLAAFYILPAVYEQKWVNISEAISCGLRPQDNFLFARTTDRDHDAFNHLVSWIALAEILVTLVAVWASRRWRGLQREAWNAALAWAAAITLLVIPVSTVLWKLLPKLEFMQFPWRWMLCFGVAFSLFLTVATRRWSVRLAVYAAMLAVIAFGWACVQPPWWDTAADLSEMQDNMESGQGYEGTDEYTPVGADASEVDKTARRVTVDGPARAAIHVLQWDAEARRFTAQMSAPANLALHLFNYPAWQLEVNGRAVRAGSPEGSGQMLVPVGAGLNRVEIKFTRTWDRVSGTLISGLSVLLVLIVLVLEKSRALNQSV